MTDHKYIEPELGEDIFTCPHCWAISHQKWHDLYYNTTNWYNWVQWWQLCKCECCKDFSIRKWEDMIYPFMSIAPLPHEDMPNDVKELYEEASNISSLSPRAAAALLRVCLEKLTIHLWESEWNLNTRIWNLQKKWLPEKVIKWLDILRINANEWWSHAWLIDLTWKDNQEIVWKLFWLVNYIVEKVITENKEIDLMFDKLPEDKKKWIENRDK